MDLFESLHCMNTLIYGLRGTGTTRLIQRTVFSGKNDIHI